MNTITLEKYVKDNHKIIKFLKIEAEDLSQKCFRAKNILKKVEYIGVDGGPERGKKWKPLLNLQLNFF